MTKIRSSDKEWKEELKFGASNYLYLGPDKFESLMSQMISEIQIQLPSGSHLNFSKILKTTCVLGAFAGVSAKKTEASEIFEKLGFVKKNIWVMTDAESVLNLFRDHSGAVLIAGTGSICLARDFEVQKLDGKHF